MEDTGTEIGRLQNPTESVCFCKRREQQDYHRTESGDQEGYGIVFCPNHQQGQYHQEAETDRQS
jgi:hypothetical protein